MASGPHILLSCAGLRSRGNKVPFRRSRNSDGRSEMRMGDDNAIDAVIASFKNWSQPWTFEDAVIVLLNDEDRKRFELAWSRALDFALWDHPELSEGVRRCKLALDRDFPELSRGAKEAIARAASYYWR